MTLRQQLSVCLQEFDDEALIALANRGLFRRASKDLELHTPQLVDDSGPLRLTLAGQHIEFSAPDPRTARCDCKAGSICHHVLAALIWLKRQPLESTNAPNPTGVLATQPAPAPSIDADALLLSFDDAALKQFAGTSGFRWALSYALDLDLEREFVISVTRYPILRLPRLHFELRCVGNALAQFIASGPASAAAKHTVAALLAYRRSCGQTLPAPEQRAMDAGDIAARTRLLQEICQFASELISLGLTHLSTALSERNELLASRAQAHGCYRLAARLRRCGEQIDAALARMAHSESAALLDELGFAYTLAQGLLQALRDGRWPRQLLGQARQDYEETDALTLWGVAAWAFQSASGFKGLSVLFYAPAENEFLTLTDARPAALSFDPFARFTQFGPWRNMASPRAMLTQALQIQHARRAGQRLSAHEESTVQSLQTLSVKDFMRLPQISDWRALPRADTGSVWLNGGEDYAVLKPSRWQAAHFDAHRQQLSWTLLDEQAQALTLTLAYSAMHARALSAWESFAQAAAPSNTLIVVRVRDEQVEPLGWLQHDGVTITAGTPFFSEASAAPAPTLAADQQPAANHPELTAWRQCLLLHAERGLGAAWVDDIDKHRARAEAHGLLKLAALAASTPAPEALLRCWVYLQQVSANYRNLLGRVD